jgi:hypothetical protein
MDDTFLFIILQIRNGLQFNSAFLKEFIGSLELSDSDLTVLDVWVIFALYSITHQKQRVQQLILKLAGKTLTVTAVRDAVVGHEKALDSFKGPMVFLMSWCLSSSQATVFEAGRHMALSFIAEFTDRETLSDTVSALATQLGISEGGFQLKVADILWHLSQEFPEKLASEVHLIEGLLWCSDAIPLQLFAKIATIVCCLKFRTPEGISDGSQLHIGFSKMAASNRVDVRKLGVLGMAIVLMRYDRILRGGHQVADLYGYIMSLIGNDLDSILLLYKTLYDHKDRSPEFNGLLIDHVSKQMELIVSEGAHFLQLLVVPPKPRSTQRNRWDGRTTVVVFTSLGMSLLMDAHLALNHDLREVCPDLATFRVELPIDGLSIEDELVAILSAHSFTMYTLGYFSEYGDAFSLERTSHLLEIEDRLVATLASTDSFSHPIFGDVFPKHRAFIKRSSGAADPTLAFIAKYRSFFAPPMPQLMKLFRLIEFPIQDARLVLRLVLEYEYIISPGSSPLFVFECSPFISLEVVGFMANVLLPALIHDPAEIAVSVCEHVLNVLKTQLSVSIYKDKTKYAEFLLEICGNDSPKACFKHFGDILETDVSQPVQLSVLLFLKALLTAGPSQKWDVCGREYKFMSQTAKKMLCCQSPVLPKSDVKILLPIFFEYHDRVLDDVSRFITVVFTVDILGGQKHDEWASLSPDTFVIYFTECFIALNRRLTEIKRKVTAASFALSEEIIATIMNRLNKIVALLKGLMLHICSAAIPVPVLRTVLKQGCAWADTSVALFPFLTDAKQCDAPSVSDFLEFSRAIKRQVQVVVDHVRRNVITLHPLLPAISKSLASWSYSLKSVIRGDNDEAFRLEAARERALSGELADAISSQTEA